MKNGAKKETITDNNNNNTGHNKKLSNREKSDGIYLRTDQNHDERSGICSKRSAKREDNLVNINIKKPIQDRSYAF